MVFDANEKLQSATKKSIGDRYANRNVSLRLNNFVFHCLLFGGAYRGRDNKLSSSLQALKYQSL